MTNTEKFAKTFNTTEEIAKGILGYVSRTNNIDDTWSWMMQSRAHHIVGQIYYENLIQKDKSCITNRQSNLRYEKAKNSFLADLKTFMEEISGEQK